MCTAMHVCVLRCRNSCHSYRYVWAGGIFSHVFMFKDVEIVCIIGGAGDPGVADFVGWGDGVK